MTLFSKQYGSEAQQSSSLVLRSLYQLAKPSVGTIAKRALIRFVPFDPISFGGQKVRGWHDKWSGTYVIKAKRFERKKDKIEKQLIATPLSQKEGIINENLLKQISSEEVKLDSDSDTQAIMLGRLEACVNCNRIIGKLEQSYIFKNHIVCKQCYSRLERQKKL